jgi:phosphopantothenoylcysteine decarboxylase / phosphopantothenate---cysteine ligase
VALPDPPGVETIKVETAQEMLSAVEHALPVDAAVFAAAVADWRPDKPQTNKIKKERSGTPTIRVTENPDILATVAHAKKNRPRLVVGFAAETDHIIEHAKAKLVRKGCDWILANDVSAASGVMGGDNNRVHLVTHDGCEPWLPQSKEAVARALVARMAQALGARAG